MNPSKPMPDMPPPPPPHSPPAATAHESRLDTALRELLGQCRVAALGTTNAAGCASVSMVPYAVEPAHGWLVLHVSGLAAHTAQLQQQPMASLMVMQPEVPGTAVHALPRVTLSVLAHTPEPRTAEHGQCHAAYFARFPEALPMAELPDFRLVALKPLSARQVAGFGAARSLDEAALRPLLQTPPSAS